jgi:hypothetical protein
MINTVPLVIISPLLLGVVVIDDGDDVVIVDDVCGVAIVKRIEKKLFFKFHSTLHPFQQAHLCVKRNL